MQDRLIEEVSLFFAEGDVVHWVLNLRVSEKICVPNSYLFRIENNPSPCAGCLAPNAIY
jgi:hypothetical protein